jgi:hypothetical protein
MELQARVTALEEELAIVKGEIKAILQEVRVAVLARQNPFIDNDFGDAPSLPASNGGWPEDAPQATAPMMTAPTQAPQAAPTPLRVVSVASAPEPAKEPEPAPHESKTEGARKTRLDLAALLSWVQETAEQFNADDFKRLVQIGAYGGLIDEGLHASLIELSEGVSGRTAGKASLADFALALQKLEALGAGKTTRDTNNRRAAA